MNVVDNELVRKYFGAGMGLSITKEFKLPDVAYNVLMAMQQPIAKGERYLLIDSEVISEKVADSNSLDHTKHLGALRLPDRFQTKDCPCLLCGYHHPVLGGYPAPERGKCDHNGKHLGLLCPEICECNGGAKKCDHPLFQSPGAAVEEKINQMKSYRPDGFLIRWQDEVRFEKELRELVRLARGK
jgi:hypothetical protein